MLTALGEADDRVRGFDSGADIYLVKHSSLREIEATVNSLLRRLQDPQPAAGRQPDLWLLSRSRSAEHTSELQSLMRISYAVVCSKKTLQRVRVRRTGGIGRAPAGMPASAETPR